MSRWIAPIVAGLLTPMWLVLFGVLVIPNKHPLPDQYDIVCAKPDGTNMEVVGDAIDLHGNILQVWHDYSKPSVEQIKDPVCVIHIVDHHFNG